MSKSTINFELANRGVNDTVDETYIDQNFWKDVRYRFSRNKGAVVDWTDLYKSYL